MKRNLAVTECEILNTFIIMNSLRLKTNKERSVKTPTSKKSISPKHFFNEENVAPTRTRQKSTTPQYMSGDDLFSLYSVTKQVVRDSGSDDGECGKSVFEDDDEIFSLPDPELNKTNTVLLLMNLCSPLAILMSIYLKTVMLLIECIFLTLSRLRSSTLEVWVDPIHKQI